MVKRKSRADKAYPDVLEMAFMMMMYHKEKSIYLSYLKLVCNSYAKPILYGPSF